VKRRGASAIRVRTGHPEVPWRVITGMRHRVSHGYFDIDLDVVWNTVTRDRNSRNLSPGSLPGLTREQKTRGEQPSGPALADGAIAPVDLTSTDYARMADLVNLYKSLRWEPLMPRISLSPSRPGLTDVAALDRRHPTVVRPSTRMR
jgi:Protein of unknown function DUF86